MANAISISDFSSLNFRKDWIIPLSVDTDYVQKFRSTDTIRVQYALTDTSIAGDITARATSIYGTKVTLPAPKAVFTYLSRAIYEVVFTPASAGLSQTRWTFSLRNGTTTVASTDFLVCDRIEDTVLFEITDDRNAFDTYFAGRTFQFRVEGVFLPEETSFGADTDTFRDQQYGLHQLSTIVTETFRLTLGGGRDGGGVPCWVAAKVNAYLAASSVTIDGLRYVRGDGAAPTRVALGANFPLSLYTVELERYPSPYRGGTITDLALLAAEDDRIVNTETGEAIDMTEAHGRYY